MKTIRTKIVALLGVLVLGLSLIGGSVVYAEDLATPQEQMWAALSTADISHYYEATGKLLADTNKSIVYGDYKEGYLIGLGRSGQAVDDNLYSGYYDSVKAYLAANTGKFGSPSECAKVVAALNSIGYDASSVDGIDITGELSDDATGEWGISYALIALDTKAYASDKRDTYINALVSSQLSNGSWGWDGVNADNDTVGIVLAALAPYYGSNSDVTAAVDKALSYLSSVQCESGAYESMGTENSNTTAMILLGLAELGIDVDNDARFIKNGNTVVDGLCKFALYDGGFGWDSNEELNDYATYQSYYALCSYYRNKTGMNRLFDMTAEKNIPDNSTDDSIDAPAQQESDKADSATPSGKTVKVSSVPKTGDKILGLI